MSSDSDYAERRSHQRFAALRDGKPCITLHVSDQRIEIIDLSVDGFSVAKGTLNTTSSFDFEMRLIDGFGDKVKGRAESVNEIENSDVSTTGCKFLSLADGSEKILHEWLTVIVICGASVRLTPADAEAIVKGPSLI
jgi:hypothetical protein